MIGDEDLSVFRNLLNACVPLLFDCVSLLLDNLTTQIVVRVKSKIRTVSCLTVITSVTVISTYMLIDLINY